MLSRMEIERIQKLHTEGFSQRQISRRTGFARETVRRVLKGRHRRLGQAEAAEPQAGEVARCRDCGGLVMMPCLACRVRSEAIAKSPHLSSEAA